jgi:hypothetical protein
MYTCYIYTHKRTIYTYTHTAISFYLMLLGQASICMYTHSVHLHVHAHMCAHAYVHTLRYILHTAIRAAVNTYAHPYIHTYTHIHSAHSCTGVSPYLCASLHTYIHTHTHTHTHSHTHIYSAQLYGRQSILMRTAHKNKTLSDYRVLMRFIIISWTPYPLVWAFSDGRYVCACA